MLSWQCASFLMFSSRCRATFTIRGWSSAVWVPQGQLCCWPLAQRWQVRWPPNLSQFILCKVLGNQTIMIISRAMSVAWNNISLQQRSSTKNSCSAELHTAHCYVWWCVVIIWNYFSALRRCRTWHIYKKQLTHQVWFVYVNEPCCSIISQTTNRGSCDLTCIQACAN